MMINKTWDIILKEEFEKEYFKNLGIFIKKSYQEKKIYPQYNDIFNALRYTDYDEVKIVILGQDPYHGDKEAHGLSFSVPKGIKFPPSLKNIFLELKNDLGIEKKDSDLTVWAKQGVLLLNAIMTVEKDKPLSHKNKGWETFTDSIIKKLSNREQPMVFILWGNYARSKKELINTKKHVVIESVHPSPLSASRGFFGSKPFSKANAYLEKFGYNKINW